MRRLAKATPDFVYSTGERDQCDYFPTPANPQGCLIGAATRKAGADLDTPGYIAKEASRALTTRLDLQDEDRNANHAILRWLDNVQERQDAGRSWSVAVTFADMEEADIHTYMEELHP